MYYFSCHRRTMCWSKVWCTTKHLSEVTIWMDFLSTQLSSSHSHRKLPWIVYPSELANLGSVCYNWAFRIFCFFGCTDEVLVYFLFSFACTMIWVLGIQVLHYNLGFGYLSNFTSSSILSSCWRNCPAFFPFSILSSCWRNCSAFFTFSNVSVYNT